jgi:uncharacterized protein YbjT (DUF2867 family)
MATQKKLIAVAGGTSPTLGKAIVDALANSQTCAPIIISRMKPNEKQPASRLTPSDASVPIRYADYTSKDSLISVLRGVHTVICVIKIVDETWGPTQITLLNAAKEAGVSRFAPSEFELGARAAGLIDLTAPTKGPVWDACKKSGLEVTRFQCGGFYQALLQYAERNPRWDEATRKRIEDAGHGLVDDDHMWSLQRESAHELVTEQGTSPRITLTDIADVGRFVAAACELPDGKWKEDMSMVGQTLTMKEVTETLEEVSGVKLRRERLDPQALKKKIYAVKGIGRTEEEIIGKLWNQIEAIMVKDEEDAGVLRAVVNELCPQVKPQSIREYLERVFK